MRNMEQRNSLRMMAKYALLMVYLAVLSYMLFFAERFGRTHEHVFAYNVVPFHEIGRYIRHAETIGWQLVVVNLLGNVAAFLPFGFLMPSLWPENDKKHPIGVTLLSMLFSVVVEILQFVTRVGTADVDDVILNTLGGFLGYVLYVLWRKIRYGRINMEG